MYKNSLLTLQECRKDYHYDATFLRQQRVRAYQLTYTVNSEVCQENSLFQIECFLIVDNVHDEDSGEYTINVTSTHYPSSFSITRSVNVSIGIYVHMHAWQHYIS